MKLSALSVLRKYHTSRWSQKYLTREQARLRVLHLYRRLHNRIGQDKTKAITHLVSCARVCVGNGEFAHSVVCSLASPLNIRSRHAYGCYYNSSLYQAASSTGSCLGSDKVLPFGSSGEEELCITLFLRRNKECTLRHASSSDLHI